MIDAEGFRRSFPDLVYVTGGSIIGALLTWLMFKRR